MNLKNVLHVLDNPKTEIKPWLLVSEVSGGVTFKDWSHSLSYCLPAISTLPFHPQQIRKT
jgi:hypothetical protein